MWQRGDKKSRGGEIAFYYAEKVGYAIIHRHTKNCSLIGFLRPANSKNWQNKRLWKMHESWFIQRG
jgi:hypothetical protein